MTPRICALLFIYTTGVITVLPRSLLCRLNEPTCDKSLVPGDPSVNTCPLSRSWALGLCLGGLLQWSSISPRGVLPLRKLGMNQTTKLVVSWSPSHSSSEEMRFYALLKMLYGKSGNEGETSDFLSVSRTLRSQTWSLSLNNEPSLCVVPAPFPRLSAKCFYNRNLQTSRSMRVIIIQNLESGPRG